MCIYIYIYIYMCVCVCVYVGMWTTAQKELYYHVSGIDLDIGFQ
jgi:hypothetical protein